MYVLVFAMPNICRLTFALPVLVFVLYYSPDLHGGETVGNDRPNFVFILVDDLGWADLSCYGSVFHETPRLDRMADEGIRFTNAYAACAVCSPTRAALQTGLYPGRTGITDWIRGRFQGGIIPPDGRNPNGYDEFPDKAFSCPKNKLFLETDYLTIAEHLQSYGYTTCHIGKWHLGQEGHAPTDQGYDINIGGCDLGQPPSYFDPYESNRPNYLIPKDVLRPRRTGEYLTDREGDEAVRFIREHKEKPFFLHLAHYAVHTPLQGKDDLVEKYRNKLERLRKDGKEPSQKNAVYAAMIESVDDALGKVLDALREEGLDEKTYVIFTSDNGGELQSTSNAPLRSGKGYPFEGGIREPLIVRAPGRVKAGLVSDTPTVTVDFFPTICELADVPLPETKLDGLSISPVLLGENGVESERIDALKDRPIFWHFPHYRGNDRNASLYSMVRRGEWKLIHFYEGNRLELYNLLTDPYEKNNRAATESEISKELRAILDSHLESIGAKMPIPKPGG